MASEAIAKDGKKNFFKRIPRFFKDLRSEFKKIVWPGRKQVANNTLVVILFVAAAAVFIWSLDWIFVTLFNLMFQ